MGREVKRVPIDFDWPMKIIWPGFMLGQCNNMDYCSKRSGHDQCFICNLYRKHTGQEYDLKGEINCLETKVEVPEGEGWQMWETTSEGSPISPVFDTPEKLAQWLADTGASTFGRMIATYDQWLTMIKSIGGAPSCVAGAGVIKSGVEAVGELSK